MASWHFPLSGDPLSSITACADSCATLLTSISAIPDPIEWHGTSRHVWDEERTRFLLWVHDLQMVHSELSEAEPAFAQRIAKTSISANLGDLNIDLQEVCAVVSGLRPPLEQQDDHGASTCFDSSEDAVDFQEVTERLLAVRATIDGLFRTLKLQYSYCLSMQSSRTLPPTVQQYPQEQRRTAQPPISSFATGQWAQQLSRSDSIVHASPDNIASRVTSSKLLSVPGMGGDRQSSTTAQQSQDRNAVPDHQRPVLVSHHYKAFEVPRVKVPGSGPRQDPISGSASEQEVLDPGFKTRASKFFSVGRVILVLWSEPAGASSGSSINNERMKSGELIYTKVRRFIIISQQEYHCLAVPIITYGKMGVAKRGVDPKRHAVAYTGQDEIMALDSERGLHSPGVRIVADRADERLDPMSRINFGKIYTIEKNIKVKCFGMVHDSHMGRLSQYLRASSELLAPPKVRLPGDLEGWPQENKSGNDIKTREKMIVVRGSSRVPIAEYLRSRASDSGYGGSAMSGMGSVASSTVDDNPAGRAEEDDDLGSGRVHTFLDHASLEAAAYFNPDNPSPQHIQGLSDSTIEILVASLQAEQQRRYPGTKA